MSAKLQGKVRLTIPVLIEVDWETDENGNNRLPIGYPRLVGHVQCVLPTALFDDIASLSEIQAKINTAQPR